MKQSMKKKIIVILSVSALLSLVLFLSEQFFDDSDAVIQRNTYGEGEKVAEYEVTVEGEMEDEPIQIEVEEQEYTKVEIQKIFRQVCKELDGIILGENASFDRVEKNLNLVTELEGYPVQIEWQLDSYSLMNLYGEIQQENLASEGTLVEIRGVISYGEEECVYTRHARIYPLTRTGVDKLLYEIGKAVTQQEEETRKEESFTLPEVVAGKRIQWSQKKESRWHYVLAVGIVLSVYLVYREREKVKRQAKQRKDELIQDFPGMISKFTMLLSTGTTVRHTWEKIVQNYESQKEQLGVRHVYEEMAVTLREIQGGVSEVEAYEQFGKRCGVTSYIKFGTLLSQNLRKGSKGLSDILRMEAIQSFENRKNRARRLGEEAGTKLLMPMLGMLAVVFIIVMVPAFLTMQL